MKKSYAKPNGLFFSIFKNIDDYVFSQGQQIETHTRKYDQSFYKLSNPCTITFLSWHEIPELLSEFKICEINSDRWTYNNGKSLNSHWIITAKKK